MNPNLDPSTNVNWVPGITLAEMEKQCILKAFRFYRENKTQTAGALGISIRTLDNKLKEYETHAQEQQDRAAAERERNAQILDRMRGVQLTKQFGQGSSIETASVETRAKITERDVETRNGPYAGVYMESAPNDTAEQILPVSERQEIQEVLPKYAAASGNKKRR